MCGIAGIYNRSPSELISRELIDRMTDVLAHRGPDDRGTWLGGNVAFGHRRLAIRDLTPAGRQPISDPQGLVTLVFNGEIYNDAPLRRELERRHGARFQSRCDTEVLPAAFLAWGPDAFARLEGMFAIALWDSRDRSLWLARDPVGIKPLFVSDDGQCLRFGSELKALLQDPAQTRTLSTEAVHRYLAQGYVGAHSTLLREVEQLAPGSWRHIGSETHEERIYWSPKRDPTIFDMATALKAFDEAWEPVVESLLPSDVPLGVLQSGGIDSSLVTLQACSKHRLPLFTAGFSESSHDETALASLTANAAGLPLQVVPVELEGDAEDVFQQVVHHFDGQLADSSAFAVYRLSEEVRRHVTVVLGGDGADEFFGGYDTYRASRVANLLQPLTPHTAAHWLAPRLNGFAMSSEARMTKSAVAARFLWGLAAPRGHSHAHWRRLLFPDRLDALYGPALQSHRVRDPLDQYVAALERTPGSFVDRCLLADQTYYLPADMLMKVDAMSMAHGLEVRVPFLERRMMDLAGSLATPLLCGWVGHPKRILRRALEQRGAAPAVVRGSKRGFQVPVARLLRGPLSALATRVLDRDAERLEPLLDPPGVRALWQAHLRGSGNHGYAVWTLLTLGVWMEQLGSDAKRLLHAG